MKFKRSMFILFMAVFLLFIIAGVCAGDSGENATDTDDTLQASEDIQVMEENDEDETLQAYDDGKFQTLQNKINDAEENSTITLSNRYDILERDGFTTGGIVISKSLTIDGAGNTVNGNMYARIFKIESGANVTLKNIVFTLGLSDKGAAIVNEGELTLIGCDFYRCTASTDGGAIFNPGILTVQDSQFRYSKVTRYNGGAIHNGGTLTVTNTEFLENTAGADGAAIFNQGTAEVFDCRFNSNSASSSGAAIMNDRGNMTVVASTFYSNTAKNGDGGAVYNRGKLLVNGSQFRQNSAKKQGDALYSSESDDVVVQNSMFVDNNTVYGIDLDGTNTFPAVPAFELEGLYNATRHFTRIVVTETVNPDTFNGDVSLDVGGSVYTVTLANGTGISEPIYSLLAPGKYNATLDFNGTDDFTQFSDYFEFLALGESYASLKVLISESVKNQVYELILDSDFGFDPDDDWQGCIVFDDDLLDGHAFTIDGNGHSISGKEQIKIFSIASGANLTLKNLNLIEAWDQTGGAVTNEGEMTIVNCSFRGNAAQTDGGAIINPGTMTIINSTFSDNMVCDCNGGAIHSAGTLYAENTAFTNNSAQWDGGALYCQGAAEVVNSTFTDNHAYSTSVGGGGAVMNDGGSLTVTESLFKENDATAYGGSIHNRGEMSIAGNIFENNTCAESGDAIFTDTADNVTIENNIFVDGNGVSGIELDDTNHFSSVPAFDVSAAYNSTHHYAIVTVTETANQNSFSGNVSLYVGGDVYTITLSNGTGMSEPIYYISAPGRYNATLAFEGSDSYPPAETEDFELVIDGKTFRDLRDEISRNVTAHIYEIVLDGDYICSPDDGLEDGITINGSLLEGNVLIIMANGFAIDGNDMARIFSLVNGAQVMIVDANLRNARGENGAAIRIEGSSLTVINSTFESNHAVGEFAYGGAIYNLRGTLVMSGSTFTLNGADNSGPAVYNLIGNATINDCLFEENEGRMNGVMYNCDRMTVVNSTFKSNRAADYLSFGGAIFNSFNGILTVENSTFTENCAEYGGAICSDAIALTVVNSTFTENYAEYGGAIYCTGTTLEIFNSTFAFNFAGDDGGAILIYESETVEIEHSRFLFNSVEGTSLDDTNEILYIPQFQVFTVWDGEGLVIVAFETENKGFTANVTVAVEGENYTICLVDGIGRSEPVGSALAAGTYDAVVVFNGSGDYPSKDPEDIRLQVVGYDSFTNLRNIIAYNVRSHSPEVTLDRNFTYSPEDSQYGILIDEGLLLGNAVVIDGDGHVIDAKGSAGIFNIRNSNMTIKNLSLINGHIYNGAAIYADGSRLTVIDSSFANNTAEIEGGAIYAYDSQLTVIDSEFTNNTAEIAGGAINNFEGDLTVFNSTFTDNRANFAGAVRTDPNYDANITYSRFFNNDVYGAALDNTNFASNPPEFELLTVFEDDAWRIIATETANIGFEGNITLTLPNETVVIALADGIGRSGQVHSLTPGVCQVTLSFNGTDKYVPVDSKYFMLHVVKSDSFSNLQNMIIYNARMNVYEITLDRDFTLDTLDNHEGSISLDNFLLGKNTFTIDGAGHTLDASNSYNIFYIDNCGVVIKNLNLINGSDYYGGAIYAYASQLTIVNSTFTNNLAEAGGAIYSAYEGRLTVVNSTFTGNAADDSEGYGGAISCSGNLTVSGSRFTSNAAAFKGGAIHCLGDFSIADSTFENNTAEKGGALWVQHIAETSLGASSAGETAGFDGAKMIGLVLSHNRAGEKGGAIYSKGILSVADSLFTDNTAAYGSAIYTDGMLSLSGSNFTANHANESGTVYLYEAVLEMSSSNFEDNFAGQYGGALYCENGHATVTDSTFNDNRASCGGAFYGYGDNLTIAGCAFTNNTAEVGGAIYVWMPSMTVKSTVFTANHADYGGAIYNDEAALLVDSSGFAGNDALEGGAIYSSSGELEAANSSFSGNVAYGEGGALYDAYNYLTALTGCNLTDNHAIADSGSGGAILQKYGTLIITGCELSRNTASGNMSMGGAIHNVEGTVIIADSTLSHNEAAGNFSYGGAISSTFKLNITGSAITSNRAAANVSAEGGAIYNTGVMNVANSTISDNTASGNLTGSGGAILNAHGESAIGDSTLTNNTAEGEISAGGAIFNYEGGALNVTASTFEDNAASNGTAFYSQTGENVTVSDTRFIDDTVEGAAIDDTNKFLTTPVFVLTVPDFLNGSAVEISVAEISMGSGFNGNVTVTLGGEEYLIEVKNGRGSLTVTPDMTYGRYVAGLSFNETDEYYCASAESNPFQVSIRPDIRIRDIADIRVGDSITLILEANSAFTGEVNVTIGDASYIVKVVDGKANTTVTPKIPSGTYRACVSYQGNENYTQEIVESNFFKVNKVEIPPEDHPFNVDENQTVEAKAPTFSLTLPDDATGNLSVTIAGETFIKELVNGSASIPIAGFSPGTYAVTLAYSGDEKYAPIAMNATAVIVVDPKIVMKQTSVLYTGKYSVTVYGKDGKLAKGVTVTFYVNGKKVKAVKTNSKGVATFNMPNSYVIKKYNIKAAALSKTASKKVTVKQILSIKSVTVKRSAKKLVLTATLKKVDGKYLKGKKITFKFNGKKYNAKTNSKGVAKLTIKSAVLKKLKVNKKIAYQATYLKVTVKKTAKVRK